jgi:hypothetical protein
MECLRGEGELSRVSRVLMGNVTGGLTICLRAREGASEGWFMLNA